MYEVEHEVCFAPSRVVVRPCGGLTRSPTRPLTDVGGVSPDHAEIQNRRGEPMLYPTAVKFS